MNSSQRFLLWMSVAVIVSLLSSHFGLFLFLTGYVIIYTWYMEVHNERRI